jgi:hypothetical protein
MRTRDSGTLPKFARRVSCDGFLRRDDGLVKATKLNKGKPHPNKPRKRLTTALRRKPETFAQSAPYRFDLGCVKTRGTISADPIWTAMSEDLLKRADQALRDNQVIRAHCLGNLMQARAAAARVKKTLLWAKADTVRARQLGLETADRVVAILENREGNTASGSSEQT